LNPFLPTLKMFSPEHTTGPQMGHLYEIRTVQDLLGHRDPKMVIRYAQLSPAHQASAVGKLGAALTAVPEAARAVANAAPTPPDLERSRTVFSGRQTAAKRKYLENQRGAEWRRGESNHLAENRGSPALTVT
jgi:hypothetical protein